MVVVVSEQQTCPSGSIAYGKLALHCRSPGQKRKAPSEPLSRIGTFVRKRMAAVTPGDAQTPKRAVGCCFMRNRLRHGSLMPVDHSSWQGSDTINALPRGALSPKGGRLSDGWRKSVSRGQRNGLIGGRSPLVSWRRLL